MKVGGLVITWLLFLVFCGLGWVPVHDGWIASITLFGWELGGLWEWKRR